jgi:hypoxanthine phosphoribosyltransferase
MIRLKDKTFVPYLSEVDIQAKIQALALQINKAYAGKTPWVIGILNGSFRFLSDLVKALNIPVRVSFIRVASYHSSTQSAGKITEVLGLTQNITGEHILLVEDIVDTGLTLHNLILQLQAQNPSSLSIAALLFKKESLQYPIDLAYVGFEIPNRFVVGYGLDYDEYGRELNEIYQLENATSQ